MDDNPEINEKNLVKSLDNIINIQSRYATTREKINDAITIYNSCWEYVKNISSTDIELLKIKPITKLDLFKSNKPVGLFFEDACKELNSKANSLKNIIDVEDISSPKEKVLPTDHDKRTDSKSIVLFLGAGASFQFNKPTTKEFKQKLSKKYKGSELIQSFLDCPGFEDIEHVLESLKNFESAHNTYLMKYLKNAKLPGIAENTGEFFTKLTRERDNIQSDIMHDLFSTYKWDESKDDNPASKFYNRLFDIISKYSRKIYIGTTNYDQAIEQACALSNLKYECIDGFEYYRGDISKWNGKKFTEEFTGQGIPVYLYKIHGSLNWKDDGSRNIEKNNHDINFHRGSGRNILISPTLSPKTAQEKEPYSTLLSELKSKLEKAEVCIVIGFSFRDKHIGEAFQKFIKSGKKFIVISPSCDINYSDNLFDQKFNSGEARVAWLRQHRNGKELHFISQLVEEITNEKIFQQLEEILRR